MAEDVTKIRAALEMLRVPNPAGTRNRSWTRGTFRRKIQGAERYCILGAMNHVGGSQEDRRVVRQMIEEQYPEELAEGYVSIPRFNDRRYRKFSDVESLLEKAAVKREEEGATSAWTLS